MTLKQLAKRILRRPEWDAPNDFEANPNGYITKYAEHGDRNVRRDPQQAAGGHWEEIGGLQFGFLLRHGLKPWHRFLDVGCATLRAGRWMIRYLEPGNYTGVDISPAALRYGRRLVRQERLTDRRPRLILSDGNLKFEQFGEEKFDYVIAQSVFTHLMDSQIDECLSHVHRVLSPTGAFYFTAWIDDVPSRPTPFEFRQVLSLYEQLTQRHGLAFEDLSSDYPHPRNQRMFRVRPLSATSQ